MSKVVNIHDYVYIKKQIELTEKVVKDLDKVAEILYNNIGNASIFHLIQEVEGVRIDYYVKHDYYVKELRKYGQEKS